ncbi:hypothetical protein [Cohnella zeiphila]|uniref:Uncharacterized protein n=1 Tax=Cohnella zeiphila TaxID=2761120 RepID=A0A7X0VT27_9BACL|nr:hypothetical protein [Cohnella zeiphila]MBB6729429.1 hypothetical protein [Cohnella zeiphila]
MAIGASGKTLEILTTDDELEELARQIIEGLSREDARTLCLALYELYNGLTKPIYH